MKKISLYLVLIISIVTSCSDREKGFQDFNSKPNIQIVSTEGDTISFLNSYTDSIRYSNDTSTYYNIRLRLGDADQNLYRAMILIDSGRIEAYYDGKVMQNPSLRVDQEYVSLSLIPKQIGTNNITFRLEDKFNQFSESKLTLFVFDNLLPVATFDEYILNPEILEYKFDASKSYDKDSSYGGKIVAYEWNINGYIFTTSQPSINHVFSRKGNYFIRLRVMDNNKSFSNIIEKRLSI